MEFDKYVRKPFEIEAVLITEDNIDECAKYIGDVEYNEETGDPEIRVDRRLVPNVRRVVLGCYMTRLNDRIRVFFPEPFAEQFELLESAVEDTPHPEDIPAPTRTILQGSVDLQTVNSQE